MDQTGKCAKDDGEQVSQRQGRDAERETRRTDAATGEWTGERARIRDVWVEGRSERAHACTCIPARSSPLPAPPEGWPGQRHFHKERAQRPDLGLQVLSSTVPEQGRCQGGTRSVPEKPGKEKSKETPKEEHTAEGQLKGAPACQPRDDSSFKIMTVAL